MALRRQELALKAPTEVSQMHLTYTSRHTRSTNMSTHSHASHNIIHISDTNHAQTRLYTHITYIYISEAHDDAQTLYRFYTHTHKSRIYHFGMSLGTRTPCLWLGRGPPCFHASSLLLSPSSRFLKGRRR